ncbi:MAG TPA: hypothetical protein VLL52_17475 [Anaerolineae bacterium]|nr:hypothetical protein [Anaerolineae bacterium]
MKNTKPLPPNLQQQIDTTPATTDAHTKYQQLQSSWDITEPTLVSHTPLLGPLITRFRQVWLNIATRWYLQALRQQQIEFNSLTVQQINHHHHQLNQHQDHLKHALDWLVTQSQHNHDHTHDLAQIRLQLRNLNQRLDHLESLIDQHQADKS